MADPRFSALSKDPRYRLPSRKEARTAVDPRFGRLFTDQDFRKKASVDRYGRKIKSGSGKKELERLYHLDEQEPAAEDEKAREKTNDELVGGSDEESGDANHVKDPARQGGFSESSSSEEELSEDESEDDEERELAEDTAGQEQTEEIPLGEVSHRFAAVNLDWDNIRAVDLMVVASSFVPGGGKIERVSIYPSEFGRERLEREEIEGPPKEIFAVSKDPADEDDDEGSDDEEDSEDGSGDDEDDEGEDDEDNDIDEDDEPSPSGEDDDDDDEIRRQLQEDQVDEGNDFDMAKLREYQLERLQYYYAVFVCDNQVTAKAIYDAMDGREYLSSANFFDLRFIPDDTSFDDDHPREECTQMPEGYRPNEFKTQALTHSKVRLTWDDDDTTRKEVQRRAFSRAEIDENDLQAYIGSDSSDAESTTSRKSAAESRMAKKEAQRMKMRAALGLSAESSKSSKKTGEPVGDMQITFTSGLSSKSGEGRGVFENEPQDGTREQYIRKERERKQKRKEKMKSARDGTVANQTDDKISSAVEEDKGFDDPFFHDPAAAAATVKKAKQAERKKKFAAQNEVDEDAEKRRAELELLMADDQPDKIRHFDMREIEKAEKDAGKNRKHRKQPKGSRAANDVSVAAAAGHDDFSVETQDPRFKALFDSHEFAIDPTNPRFKSTKGMKALLDEGRKKRKTVDAEVDEGGDVKRTGKKARFAANGSQAGGEDGLHRLVARVKQKSQ